MTPIILLPLGNADVSMVSALSLALAEAFSSTVYVRECDINLAPFFDGQRLQYNSTAIITYLHNHIEAFAGESLQTEQGTPRLLGVIDEDLFIPILTYVFGEAQLQGRVAVVSYHRLQNERYGLAPDPGLTFDRLRKEALHELGHVFGLVHCTDQDCVMHVSTYVEDIDLKPASFCQFCRDLLNIA